jgi:elongator complex protein 3
MLKNIPKKLAEQIITELSEIELQDIKGLALLKRKISKRYKLPFPSNIFLLKTYHEMVKNKRLISSKTIERLLITRPVRSLSGIVNVSVLTKPYPCPGKCLYCPKEKGVPKSYLSGEPAVERAKKLKFNPYLQVRKRIEMLEIEGHPTDKIELRIVGGTFSYYPLKYQEEFVKQCFQACNEKNDRKSKRKPLFLKGGLKLKSKIKNLKDVQKQNEKANHKIIGLSVETRPDFINKKEIKHLRMLGVTLVELGVQSIYNDVLEKNLRGHSSKEIILATKLLKDAGFKILYQIMPNLLGSNLEKDEKMFKELFKNPDFQPDFLKIYPCALLKETPLYKIWKIKKYKPYGENKLISLIKKIKEIIPCYVRIQRISRDIPSFLIIAGPAKISNIRQILSEKMNFNCKCIRCREVREEYNPKEKIYLFRKDYYASEGKEIFLSFENKKKSKLYSLLRLRITSQNKAIIREIHTYGQQLPVTCLTSSYSPQHRGLGKKLIKEAEKIAKKEINFSKSKTQQINKTKKITVIAGVGVRDYFRKIGYCLEKTYMIKKI